MAMRRLSSRTVRYPETIHLSEKWAFVPLTIIEIAEGAPLQPSRWSMECNAVFSSTTDDDARRLYVEISSGKMRLDPEVVGTPGFDRSFDLLLVKPMESLFRKGRKLGIRSKPQCDELAFGEFSNPGLERFAQQLVHS